MNSKSSLTAIISRFKPKDAGIEARLTFNEAATEIAHALKIKIEAAAMVLYGLCATGNVRWLNDQGEVIEEDECTVASFNDKPKYVIASDVRSHLTDWSSDPQPKKRENVIAEMLAEGLNPPRNIKWKPFCNRVRDECNGWLSRGQPALGFGDRQINRMVNELKSK
jgi:hypothetical protein